MGPPQEPSSNPNNELAIANVSSEEDLEHTKSPAEGHVHDLRSKKISWIQAVFVLIAETISLGILSLPAAVAVLGIILGTIMILFFSVITTAAGFMLYRLKIQYPKLKGFADAARMVAGPAGAVVVETLNMLLLVFVMAAHILTFSTEANAIAGDDTWKCTVVFKVIGLIICLTCTLPRTLKSQSWLSLISCCSIITATMIALIAIAIEKPDIGNARASPPANVTDFADWSLAISNILVSFTGSLAYFHVMEEMEKPRDFPKALVATNIIMVSMYIVVGIVIYWYAGQDVASPALGSAGPLIKKLSYGIATPTIIVAGVIAAYLACKNMHRFWWDKSRHQPDVVYEQSWRSRSTWAIIVAFLWILAFVLANVLPFFSPLLALIGAISGTWICLGLPAWYCLCQIRDNLMTSSHARAQKAEEVKSKDELYSERAQCLAPESGRWWKCFKFPSGADRKIVAVWATCWSLVVLSCFLVIIGLYGSILSMVRAGSVSYHPFTCAA
ncbi:hypothetical protein AC579_2889 [Pseudocercospora musae]|uniref:Amino acid transporter transmembrane domain-containing protein n=1 Tax=Pseudocercospora musae TaxID=113226 RepID=A0A139IU50_9PEZI|nr:hypothetical protein AC579_2889 [Pseudocercospora musae]